MHMSVQYWNDHQCKGVGRVTFVLHEGEESIQELPPLFLRGQVVQLLRRPRGQQLAN